MGANLRQHRTGRAKRTTYSDSKLRISSPREGKGRAKRDDRSRYEVRTELRNLRYS